MCVNGKWIKNKYDGRNYFVKCGHCESCLQEKANKHAIRINNEAKITGKHLLSLFVTLTYDNNHIPYILKSELRGFSNNDIDTLSVYRDGSVVSNFTKSDFDDRVNPFENLNISDLKTLRKKVNGYYINVSERVGVILKSDIQKFIKRVRINLVRNNYYEYFSYYYASEYGSNYFRPHFHVLFYIDPAFYKRFITIICKSWKNADLFGLQRGKFGNERKPIEIAKNPANYVSAYINCRSTLPLFLQNAKPFKQASHFSNGFGCNLQDFSLPKIIEKVQRGTLKYVEKRVIDGVSTLCEVRIPRYVLDRYFPKFKGYNHLLSNEVINLVQFPKSISTIPKLKKILTKDDCQNFVKRFSSLQKRVSSLGVSVDDWAFFYPRVIALYASDSIKSSYQKILELPFEFERNLFEHFNNIWEYYDGLSHGLLDGLNLPFTCQIDPNKFHLNVFDTQNLITKFNRMVKHHQIKNFYYEKKSSF